MMLGQDGAEIHPKQSTAENDRKNHHRDSQGVHASLKRFFERLVTEPAAQM